MSMVIEIQFAERSDVIEQICNQIRIQQPLITLFHFSKSLQERKNFFCGPVQGAKVWHF